MLTSINNPKAVVDGRTIYEIFDLSGSLVHVDKLSGGGQSASETDHVTGPSSTLARITDGVVTYLHNDPVGYTGYIQCMTVSNRAATG
ncbi:hypothetical protein ACFFUB_07795 [Algimonas porphyrae]|uniref:Uncharacterized protein n=1 Tax=Algimonas porphyrae TaxID=1128113 RepID=A0ABQ5V0H0_9PROT|nr:hypothetical protein [Algimonas porphyrae]GLQ20923.1 hypothetical protein GCM10007854_18780 [Algimonas porphyrae]